MATNNDTEKTKAAAFFTGALTLCAGGAGFLVAGLVLGFDYLLHGEPGERQRLAEQRAQERRGRYEQAMAWLEADKRDQAAARAARRAWFDEDRDTRGDAPPSGETLGRIGARLLNQVIVGAHRFKNGWKDGRAEAQARREAGDKNWWKPARPKVEPESRAGDDTTPPPVRPAGSDNRGVNQHTKPSADEPIDAEIVPDPPPTPREVLPVGVDRPVGDDGRLAGHDARIGDLRNEVAANGDSRPTDPSPPRTTLNGHATWIGDQR